MSRHRQVIALASIFFVVALFGSVRAEEVHIIHPTGIFPDDVYNVQSVIDNLGVQGADGKIILAACNEAGEPTSFNFGEGNFFDGKRLYVVVWGDEDSGDIAFVGETVGPAQTTIIGGIQSLFCARRAKFEVRGIRFEGAEAAPIVVYRCDSCVIENNKIFYVRGDPFGMGPGGVPKAVGIWVAANYWELNNIRGRVEIRNNQIYHVVADYAFGIAIVCTNASFEVSGNEIQNVNSVGILISDNKKPVVIEKNSVIPGPGNTPSPFSEGNGIHANFQAPFHLGDEATIHVEKNLVICENHYASGISAFGNSFQPVKNSVFAENRIFMTDTLMAGIDLGVFGGRGYIDNYIGENIIEGKGEWAIFLGEFWPDKKPSALFGNFFEQNDLNNYSSAGPDVFFDEFTRNNVYFGGSETVLDMGQHNVIVLEND